MFSKEKPGNKDRDVFTQYYDNNPTCNYHIVCELVNIVNVVDIYNGDLNYSSDHESVTFMHMMRFAHNLIVNTFNTILNKPVRLCAR